MTEGLTLTNIDADKLYKIDRFAFQDSEYAIKLGKMSFIQGTEVALAPVNLSDPMVFDIRDSRIALRKKEAR